MPKGLIISVYTNPTYRTCANGGITETADELHLICDKGPFDFDDNDPLLVQFGCIGNSVHIKPVNPANASDIGPMFGGSYAASSDARFTRGVEALSGHPFYGAVPVHDRYETQQMYNALSR